MTSINWSNVTSLEQVPALANTASGGIFWNSMLFMMWVILLLISITWGWPIALMVASFSALILGLLFAFGGLIAWTNILPYLAVILIMFVYIVWNKKDRA